MGSTTASGALALIALSPAMVMAAIAVKWIRVARLPAEALRFNNELIEVLKFRRCVTIARSGADKTGQRARTTA